MDLQALVDAASSRDWETNPEGTVSLAVVGLGNYARNVSIPAIEAGDYTRLGAVVSGTPGKAERVADEHGAVALTYERYAEGEAIDAYDAVYVATPNRLHLDHVRTAADHKKHVICEKPLEATAERAEAAVEACEDAGVTLMTAYRMQADPVVRALASFVSRGGIGEPTKAMGEFTFPVLAGSNGPDQWRLDGELAGGGALMDVGVYPLNTARYLLGADPIAVDGTATAEEPFGSQSDDPGSPRFADEHVHFHAEFPTGTVGDFTASFSGSADSWLELVGSDGRIRLENAFVPNGEREVTLETSAGTVDIAGVGADETREEFDYFAHCLLTGTPPEPDGRDGLTDVRVMGAVYQAAATGKRVELGAERVD
ncbi:MAG: D-xylose 1-dehydrogenase Gfo6 [Halolamina sp.]